MSGTLEALNNDADAVIQFLKTDTRSAIATRPKLNVATIKTFLEMMGDNVRV